MPPGLVGLLGLGFFLLLVLFGMPIAFAAGFAGVAGLVVLHGLTPALSLMEVLPYDIVAKYVFTVIPLFILMGYFADYSGITSKLYYAARCWVGHLRGGIALATTVTATGFAACCGTGSASAAVLSKVCVPQMEKYGYDTRLAVGTVASTGTLAAMIPPSNLMVIYAIMVNQSIGKLLIAGIVPGLLMAAAYVAMIYVRCRLNPSLGPVGPRVSWKERFLSLSQVWPFLFVVASVLGGIYLGIFTPVEAGAAGALITFCLALVYKGLSWRRLQMALLDTGQTTCMVLTIVIGILIFTTFLATSKLPYSVATYVADLSVNRMVVLLGMIAVYLALGMVLDSIGMLALTLPIFFPVVVQLGFDPIWFGVLVVLMCETGMITPPFGLNIFVVKGVLPHVPLEDVFRGAMPFAFMDLFVAGLMVAFPGIALFLPALMK